MGQSTQEESAGGSHRGGQDTGRAREEQGLLWRRRGQREGREGPLKEEVGPVRVGLAGRASSPRAYSAPSAAKSQHQLCSLYTHLYYGQKILPLKQQTPKKRC